MTELKYGGEVVEVQVGLKGESTTAYSVTTIANRCDFVNLAAYNLLTVELFSKIYKQ